MSYVEFAPFESNRAGIIFKKSYKQQAIIGPSDVVIIRTNGIIAQCRFI